MLFVGGCLGVFLSQNAQAYIPIGLFGLLISLLSFVFLKYLVWRLSILLNPWRRSCEITSGRCSTKATTSKNPNFSNKVSRTDAAHYALQQLTVSIALTDSNGLIRRANSLLVDDDRIMQGNSLKEKINELRVNACVMIVG